MKPMMSLLLMKVCAGGAAACWANALVAVAEAVARNVKMRNCARIRVPPVVSHVPRLMGKQPALPAQGPARGTLPWRGRDLSASYGGALDRDPLKGGVAPVARNETPGPLCRSHRNCPGFC